LVRWYDIDLIISGETIHQREDFSSDAIATIWSTKWVGKLSLGQALLMSL
jgi:hypothetical protein